MSTGMLAAGQVGGQVIGLVMLAIVTRKIGPAYLGAYAFSYNIVAYVGLAATIGLPVLGMRDVGQSRPDRRRVLIDTVAARVLLALLLGAALIFASRWIAPSPASRVLLPILAIKLLIDALTFDWFLQGASRHAVVAASRFIGQIAYVAALLPLLAGGLTGARHYVVANLVGLAVTAAVMLVLALRDVGLRFERPDIRQIRQRLRRSTPFLWWLAMTQIYYSTDLILVAYLAGDRQAGLYAAASKLPLSVIGVASLWFTVSMPETARLHSTAQVDAIRNQSRIAATTAIVAGLPFILLGPIFATDIARTLFGARFAASGPALAILSASVAVSLLQIVVTSVVMGAGRERPYVRAMSLGAAANVALNLLLIPLLGIVGAALSTIVAESVVLIAGVVQILHVTGRFEVRWRAIGEAAATGAIAAACALLIRLEVGVAAGALSVIAIYVSAVAMRTMRNPHWLGAWLGSAS
ncbi:MAG TPA: oligosaccharide flippase family protein [Solirubrobacteraceae bacterium]|jgi:O-antigen/teichoic acid export membrane protein|nr:oligosaccharide flippase family protein [Solirubrobacteraceae bacterium]